MDIDVFTFGRYQFDAANNVATFHYSYGARRFEERIFFRAAPGWQPRPLEANETRVLDKTLALLHLFAGVSYFKAFAPCPVAVSGRKLDFATASLASHFYVHGLGEFAYRNGISLRNFAFPFDEDADASMSVASDRITLPRRTVVPIGGGKDSIVTTELLKAAGEPVVLFFVGNSPALLETARVAGLPYIQVERQLDPKLFELNRDGAPNGHVPVTGIISLIAVAAAILYGFDTIAMSNERSANVGNVVHDGLEINHQYSKSFDFERRFSSYLTQQISGSIRYFSFLRPLSEACITAIFAGMEEYHTVFRSCGAGFRQDSSRRLSHWCGECDKCRFVFLALAPYLAREKLISIFQKDLLADEGQLDSYRALVGLKGHKPFECVGEISESAALMSGLGTDPEWKGEIVVQTVAGELKNIGTGPDAESLFSLAPEHGVPPHYMDILRFHTDKLREKEELSASMA